MERPAAPHGAHRPGGKIIYRQTNAIDPIEVRKAIVNHIGRTYASRKE
jgi:hypothetical protein